MRRRRKSFKINNERVFDGSVKESDAILVEGYRQYLIDDKGFMNWI